MPTRSKIQYLLVVAAISLASVGAVYTSGLLTTQTQVSFSGTIQPTPAISISVFEDSACTTPATSFSVGVLHPGESASKIYYLKNTGNSPVTITGSATNWSPSAAQTYISVTWDRDGATINAGQSLSATISMSVSPSITGISNYSFTFLISGTG